MQLNDSCSETVRHDVKLICPVVRPHRYCYADIPLSVCLSAGHNHESYKTAKPIEMDVVVDGPRETCVRWSTKSPTGRGNFGKTHVGMPIPSFVAVHTFDILNRKWQQRCGLSLPVLQQPVITVNIIVIIISYIISYQ